MASSNANWHVIVPIKSLESAKSRLALAAATRSELAVSMALDTLTAIRSTDQVAAIWLVTSDTQVVDRTGPLIDHVVWEQAIGATGDQLNAAVTQGLGAVSSAVARAPVAVVMADLPALRSHELEHVLLSASRVPLTAVPDSDGAGTTALLSLSAASLRSRFGKDSQARHRQDGAVELAASPGIRRDVDTLADLAIAYGLGVGLHTVNTVERRLR